MWRTKPPLTDRGSGEGDAAPGHQVAFANPEHGSALGVDERAVCAGETSHANSDRPAVDFVTRQTHPDMQKEGTIPSTINL